MQGDNAQPPRPAVDDKAAALATTELFGGRPPEALGSLARSAEMRLLEPGEILFLAGEPARSLFVIVTGRIRAFRVNAKGRERTIHVEGPGATLAEAPMFDGGNYPATAAAEECSKVLCLTRSAGTQFLMSNPDAALNALKLVSRRLRRHAELVDALALKDVGQRLTSMIQAPGTPVIASAWTCILPILTSSLRISTICRRRLNIHVAEPGRRPSTAALIRLFSDPTPRN